MVFLFFWYSATQSSLKFSPEIKEIVKLQLLLYKTSYYNTRLLSVLRWKSKEQFGQTFLKQQQEGDPCDQSVCCCTKVLIKGRCSVSSSTFVFKIKLVWLSFFDTTLVVLMVVYSRTSHTQSWLLSPPQKIKQRSGGTKRNYKSFLCL